MIILGVQKMSEVESTDFHEKYTPEIIRNSNNEHFSQAYEHDIDERVGKMQLEMDSNVCILMIHVFDRIRAILGMLARYAA